MGKEDRKTRGEKGRKWALSDEAGFTAEKMAQSFTNGMEELFTTWSPREKFVFLKDTDFKTRVLKHKLNY
jgi:hypothetical protein